VPLILESEWLASEEGIEYDFRKLLLGRAQHRVMIFQHRNVPFILDKLKKQVQTFCRTESGDRYLFLGWHYTRVGNHWVEEVFVA
jgi:hypothetical protein